MKHFEDFLHGYANKALFRVLLWMKEFYQFLFEIFFEIFHFRGFRGSDLILNYKDLFFGTISDL